MRRPICFPDVCEAMLFTMNNKLYGNEADRHTFSPSVWALRCALCLQQASVMKAMGQPVGRHQVGGRSTGGLLTFHCQEQDIGQQMVVYKPAALPTPERRPAVIVSVGVLGYTRGLLTPVVFQVCLPGPPSLPFPSAPIVQPPFHSPSATLSCRPACYAPLSRQPVLFSLASLPMLVQPVQLCFTSCHSAVDCLTSAPFCFFLIQVNIPCVLSPYHNHCQHHA